jgi:nickel transport protein
MRWGWLFILVTLSVPATAHDFWIETQGTQFELHRGHRHSDHVGKAELPFARGEIVGAWCRNKGKVTRIEPLNDHYPFRFSGQCDVLTIKVDSGTWTQTLSGVVHKPASDVLMPLKSWHAIETVTYVRPGVFLRQPLTDDGLSLVFRKSPAEAGSGDKVRLRVLLQDRPVKGALVAYDGQTRGDTDEEGRVNIRLRHDGTQTITASFKDYQNHSEQTKYTLYAATLLFSTGAQ